MRLNDKVRIMTDGAAGMGAIHVLVNNAEIAPVTTIEEMTLENYHRVVNINQEIMFLGMKAFVSLMRKTDADSIVNMSSIN